MSMAVRSLTLAVQTERGHLQLLEAALANLGGKPVAATYFVCPYCGRTVETLEYAKCPGCFTSSARFLRPA
jgi:rubrerythrin